MDPTVFLMLFFLVLAPLGLYVILAGLPPGWPAWAGIGLGMLALVWLGSRAEPSPGGMQLFRSDLLLILWWWPVLGAAFAQGVRPHLANGDRAYWVMVAAIPAVLVVMVLALVWAA